MSIKTAAAGAVLAVLIIAALNRTSIGPKVLGK